MEYRCAEYCCRVVYFVYFLTWYAWKANDLRASDLMRRYALIWAAPLVIAAAGIIVEFKGHNPVRFQNMVDLWWMFGISAVIFLFTIGLIWKRKNTG